MAAQKGRNEVQEVEVERLPPGEAESPPPKPDSRQKARQVGSVLGPIVAGLLIDAIDAVTLTPVLGLALGVPIGLFLARQMGLRGGAAWQLAALIGLYCAAPNTGRFPLGTLIGVYARVREALKS